MNIKLIANDDSYFDQRIESLIRYNENHNQQLIEAVRTIIATVRDRGDDALIDYTAKLDNHRVDTIDQLKLNREQLSHYPNRIPTKTLDALKQAKQRIEWFHKNQVEQSWTVKDEFGNILGQRISALQHAGLYVPGGRAAYPSSVLMNAIPAKVAGVDRLTMTMPCPESVANPTMLAAAHLCEVDEVLLIGGAQAIAAMAWGTQSIDRVDKITGPGNAYVAEAKRQAFGYTGIDMIAGPSEIVIIADGSCDPSWTALDMCAQAEHDPDARSILICPSKHYIDKVKNYIISELPNLERAKIISQSLTNNGAMIECRDLNHACTIANAIAPEHLELLVDHNTSELDKLVSKITNAGAVFVGHWSCEALGDYCAGPNHILPTGTSARFCSPLGVYDFTKRSSYIQCHSQGVASLIDLSARLGKEEGLDCHARSAIIRKNPLPTYNN